LKSHFHDDLYLQHQKESFSQEKKRDDTQVIKPATDQKTHGSFFGSAKKKKKKTNKHKFGLFVYQHFQIIKLSS